jgi:tetratricopeptide (TPR) repeat protein/Mn-dependent DtxR family transcriptional regulator
MNSLINYPPKELLKPVFGKRNFELIILWMLNNNEFCTWGDLQQKIAKSTLQIYLKKLQKEGYLTKTDYNHYEITPKGRNRYYELSKFKKKERSLSYPPKEILRKRNYDHWILWMVFNNNFCKWADFLEEPLSINQSSLSKNMNSLIEDGFIKKEEKKYIITQLGKLQYSKILKYYDLDRQTILEEESKRIKDITKNTIKFFEEHQIQDKGIQFRYLNSLLKLPHETIKRALEDEVDFHKVLLYLSINHPNQYPNYISPEKFSQKYNINLIKLKFALLRIVDEGIYPIKFFKINIAPDQYYYFQVNEKLEKMLNAIVENHITRFTYLSHLYEENSNDYTPLSIELILDEISEEVCGSLFDANLRDNLRAFLPRYIDYLAYKIKEEKPLVGIYDKLESLIWQNITELIYKKINGALKEDFSVQIKEINKKIEFNPTNLELYQLKIGILLDNNQHHIVLNLLDEMLSKFPEQEMDLKLKKAMVLKNLRQIDRGLEIINELIEHNPEEESLLSYKAYWLQYLDEEDEAINVIQDLVNINPNNSMYHDTYGEILMNFKKYSKATTEFLKAINLEPEGWFIYQTYVKLGICYKELEDYESAVTFLNNHKEPKSKKNWLSIANLFLKQISYENQNIQ